MSFLEKIPKFLEHLEYRDFQLSFELSVVTKGILDDSSIPPNIYAIDTEFARTSTDTLVTKVAIFDIKSRRLVADYISPRKIHAVRGFPRREASLTSALRAGRLSSDNVSTVYTIPELAAQIEAINIQETDIMVENSNRKRADLDLGLIKKILGAGGFESHALVPVQRAYCVQIAPRHVLSQCFQLPIWSQQSIYRTLDPQSPLVGQNHTAAVDAI